MGKGSIFFQPRKMTKVAGTRVVVVRELRRNTAF